MSVSATVLSLVCATIAQTVPASVPSLATTAPASAEGNAFAVSSALDFVLKGGWPMVPIAICSFVALTLIIERSMVIRRSRVVPSGFVRRAIDAAGDPARAMELCRTNKSPISRVFAEAIKRRNEPVDRMEKHVEEVGGRELVALRQRMRLLSVLPQVSTMLGLLGTVFGMIKTFQEVAASSEALGKTERLAEGIFEAWTCTAGGLFVAIPVMLAFHWLMGKIDAIAAEVDESASEFVERLRPSGDGASSSRSSEVTRASVSTHNDGLPAGTVSASA